MTDDIEQSGRDDIPRKNSILAPVSITAASPHRPTWVLRGGGIGKGFRLGNAESEGRFP